MRRMLSITATIGSLAPGGDGVAHVDVDGERRAVFVPSATAGDVVRVEVDLAHRPARGRILELVTASPDRVDAPCSWVARCGGCDWMHVSSEAQARTHVDQVRAALPVAWRGIDIQSHAAPEPFAYRVRARVHVQCVRRRVVVGMHEARTHEPVEVDACAVLEPTVERGRRQVAALFAGSRGRGDVQIALGVKRAPVLDVRWSGDLAPSFFAQLEQAVARGDFAGGRVELDGASRPATVGDPTPWMTGADGEPLCLAPGGFGQASERMNAELVRHVVELVRPLGIEKAVELFAGAGNLTVVLAREVRELVAVESSRESCDAARVNLAARSAKAKVVEADANAYVWGATTKLLVLDPPRTGARAVAERLSASPVAHVVYVSCDPQTLGRDLALLAPAYEPRSVATFEMFPQTSHVETVIALQRRRGGS